MNSNEHLFDFGDLTYEDLAEMLEDGWILEPSKNQYMESADLLSQIIGETVEEISINEDYLKIYTKSNKTFVYEVDGQCCSHSYFSEITNVTSLLAGHKITGIRELEIVYGVEGLRPSENDNEDVKVYGYLILSDPNLQPALLTFRNASNGYYGGYISHSDFEILNGRHTDRKHKVTDDWWAD